MQGVRAGLEEGVNWLAFLICLVIGLSASHFSPRVRTLEEKVRHYLYLVSVSALVSLLSAERSLSGIILVSGLYLAVLAVDCYFERCSRRVWRRATFVERYEKRFR